MNPPKLEIENNWVKYTHKKKEISSKGNKCKSKEQQLPAKTLVNAKRLVRLVLLCFNIKNPTKDTY